MCESVSVSLIVSHHASSLSLATRGRPGHAVCLPRPGYLRRSRVLLQPAHALASIASSPPHLVALGAVLMPLQPGGRGGLEGDSAGQGRRARRRSPLCVFVIRPASGGNSIASCGAVPVSTSGVSARRFPSALVPSRPVRHSNRGDSTLALHANQLSRRIIEL